jgi:RNA polymerase sigma-70 factor, ECF subfamily
MTDRSTEAFAGQRELLRAVAYRVLGSMIDADDVVQDAWLRWRDVDAAMIDDPRGFLVTVTTRLAIDRLRRRRAQREVYVGTWLPELVATEPDMPVELADSVSIALLVVFETLSPLERAVFVLHEVFGFSYPETGQILGRTDAAVRQLGHRARNNVQARRPRYAIDRLARREATERFLRACLGGDLAQLMAVLAPDVTLHGDTGGFTPGPRRTIFGADRVARLFAGAVDRVPAGTAIEYLDVNGSPAAAALAGGVCYAVFVVDLDPISGLVSAVYLVSNPEKLAGLGPRLAGL